MGTLLGFVVGYVMGARAGPEGLRALAISAQEIASTPEVKGVIASGYRFLSGVLRSDLKELTDGSGSAALGRAA